ncbi:MAG: DEAD/DEAH box helicase, partial [Desulfobacterales bacterium]|nr:DEAD/DEAH box helicase [Desulfobacterales bacterium]
RPDNLYNDFEASFPHEETRGQLKAIDDVQLDMESDVPMDRLVCGDVGYGKTEVAVRAAFKAVNDSKQVAIVVPTTILAEQHLNTFRKRFENYPVTIECLSRFRSRKEQTDILKRLAQGQVDIVIGTHRLLQKDVAFNTLGLLVIDEEQRFGVKHKEALKKKRSSVDVLALSATPIPRTLHLSLTGMRDISVISTPPAARQPIVSYISKFEEAIVKDAVNKELAREGQVFFVHNNVKTIFKMAEQLQELVPQAKIGVAHGQLSEAELEKVMLQFINYEINVLVCTTIVESGLDISSANTMIINKAERFGLSQIYQLRGRIGRGDHQAYAYLFISDESRLTKDAHKRLSALMEHKDLGSGFQIAMKDLQIRGAGTALGASQSGHIAAVGYDMFLKLLDQAVKDAKGEKVVEPLEPEINASMSSGFPDHYVESVEQRLTLYRRLSRLTKVSDIADMKKELIDRYGKLPKEAENMLLKVMLRVLSINAGVKRLDITPETLTLTFSPDHMKISPVDLVKVLPQNPPYTFVKKESIRFRLAKKRIQINPSLLKTREILKLLA